MLASFFYWITCYNIFNNRYAESPSEDGTDGSGGSDDLDAEPGDKTINELDGSKGADDSLLFPESQASKKEGQYPFHVFPSIDA